MKNAICIITFKPNEKKEYLEFVNSFENYDIYIIVDDNSHDYKEEIELYRNCNFIQVKDDLCMNAGFKNLGKLTLGKEVAGWDKAIYYFSKINTSHPHVWFLEDDVYFHSEKTILNADEKYKEEDILCRSYYECNDRNSENWLWKKIYIKFDPPYYASMMCATRLSKRYLEVVTKYVNKYKSLFFLEAFFPTIAKRYKIKTIDNPVELSNITYDTPITSYESFNKDFLYHPAKDLKAHSTYRTQMTDDNM